MSVEQTMAKIQDLIEQGSDYHRRGQHALSLQCYQKAITLARPLGDRGLTAYLLAAAGGEHRDCDNYHHAADLLLAALAIAPDTDELTEMRAHTKKVLAITFKDIFGPQKPEVLQLLEESRADYARSGNVGQEANVLQHIGGCYTQLSCLPEADRILSEALRKARAENDVQLEGWILDDLAELEIERDEWGQALEFTRSAREKVRSVQDLEGEGDTWVTEARVWMRMEHLEDALAAANKALEVYTQNQNQRRSIRARHHVARALVRLERVDEAVATLNEAMTTAVRLDLRRYQAILYLDLGKLELGRKNYGLVNAHAVSARSLAEAEGLDDLVDQADDLLRRCRKEERHE